MLFGSVVIRLKTECFPYRSSSRTPQLCIAEIGSAAY